MNELQTSINDYLNYCKTQKRLDEKTLKAYRIDLRQFSEQISVHKNTEIDSAVIEKHIAALHHKYQPKTVKRKIASLKAFFHFLEYKDLIEKNPFTRIEIHFREPVRLPKTIPLHTVETLLTTIYTCQKSAKTTHQKRCSLRDAAVVELLFASGMRISELCTLHAKDVNLFDGIILIYGKGSKERRIQIGNESVLCTLKKYQSDFQLEIEQCGHFFANSNGKALSDQSVRRMIKKYAALAGIDMHITPHMFRHTFATSLLEAEVDIRYIQEMLGHSSIHITEIYTHVAIAKQRDILVAKHPRKNFRI